MFLNYFEYSLLRNLISIKSFFWDYFLSKTKLISVYYLRSELLWQDGFLFDFLQKKTADAWVRRVVIYTGFLFSERLVFDTIVYLYIHNLINVAHNLNTFESSSVSEMLGNIVFIITSLFFITFLLLTLIISF